MHSLSGARLRFVEGERQGRLRRYGHEQSCRYSGEENA